MWAQFKWRQEQKDLKQKLDVANIREIIRQGEHNNTELEVSIFKQYFTVERNCYYL